MHSVNNLFYTYFQNIFFRFHCSSLKKEFLSSLQLYNPANTAGFAPHWDDIDAFLLQLEGRKHWKIYAPIDDNEMLPRLPSGVHFFHLCQFFFFFFQIYKINILQRYSCLDNFTDDDLADRTPVFDDWLEQGDMLYIPRGFIHQVKYIEQLLIAKSFLHNLYQYAVLSISFNHNVSVSILAYA